MNVLSWMQPRDHRAAARSVTILSSVAVSTTVLTLPLQDLQLDGGAVALAVGLVMVGIVLAVSAHRLHDHHRLAWGFAPIVAVATLTAMNLVTHDASVTAQVFFVFPALYGASQLRPPGAAVMAGLSVLGEIIVVGAQLPPREAVINAWYVSTAIITTMVLLGVASERHARLVTRLQQLAAIDPLTGLATRRVLDEAATSAMTGANSHAGTALLLIDVDHFKTINDRHGHPVGDEILVQLARRLTGRSRAGDVVCRLGGDEIAVLMPGCGDSTAIARAQEMLDAVHAHPFSLEDGTSLTVTISMGCAHIPTHATDLQTLYSAADSALYAAKQAGRARLASVDARDRAGTASQ